MSHEIELEIGGTRCFVNVDRYDRLYIHIGPVAVCVSKREERKAFIAALLVADFWLDADGKDDAS